MTGVIKGQVHPQNQVDPHEADLGKAWNDVKEWAKKIKSPQLNKYLDKAWEYAKPVVNTMGVESTPGSPKSVHTEGFAQYQEMLATARRFFDFGNKNSAFVNDIYNTQIALREESKRMSLINSELLKYFKNGQFMVTSESSELMDKFQESHGQIEKVMEHMHKLAESFFDQVSNYPVGAVDVNKLRENHNKIK